MKSLVLFLAMGASQLFAAPPASITLKVNSLSGSFTAVNHNGTFTLKRISSPKEADLYIYQDFAINPTVKWVVTHNSSNELSVIGGSGQFPMQWNIIGDPTTIGTIPGTCGNMGVPVQLLP